VAAYATIADLETHGVSAVALEDVKLTDRTTALEAASRVADSYVRGAVTLPLAAPYPIELVRAVSQIAAYDLLSVRGMAAESDLGRRAEAATRWLRAIGEGDVKPGWADSSEDATVGYDGPYVVAPGIDKDGNATVETPTPRGF
jgi:phage gp36-like protein